MDSAPGPLFSPFGYQTGMEDWCSHRDALPAVEWIGRKGLKRERTPFSFIEVIDSKKMANRILLNFNIDRKYWDFPPDR